MTYNLIQLLAKIKDAQHESCEFQLYLETLLRTIAQKRASQRALRNWEGARIYEFFGWEIHVVKHTSW